MLCVPMIVIFLMQTNFDINMPSIPTKMIKFKIQDIKSSAFGSQRNRFQENKTFLTKKFVESFHNFTPKKDPPQPLTSLTTTQTSCGGSKSQAGEREYRMLIPEEKKYMLHHFEKYKNYKAPLAGTAYDKGYSFNKQDESLPKPQLNKTVNQSIPHPFVDNSFFDNPRENASQTKNAPQPPQPKPTCVFQNETRRRVYTKLDKPTQEIPGPGHYITQPQPQKKRAVSKGEKLTSKEQIDYRQLKKIITNIVGEGGREQARVMQIKEARPDHMFVVDDRDRFGDQKYPIAGHVNIPGPGTYDIKDNIEGKAQKIVVVEEQRKLLKDWFNN